MVNIIIFDNEGNELYRFKEVFLDRSQAILEGAVLRNDHQVVIERSYPEIGCVSDKCISN